MRRAQEQAAAIGEQAAEAAARYAEANRYAGRYCRSLSQRYLKDGAGASMMPELRRFYRLSQGGKIRRIEGDRY